MFHVIGAFVFCAVAATVCGISLQYAPNDSVGALLFMACLGFGVAAAAAAFIVLFLFFAEKMRQSQGLSE